MKRFHQKQIKQQIWIGREEIGGIGQLIYHPFRFKKYELDIDKSDNYCATPFCRPGYEPIFPKEDFLPTGTATQPLQSEM